ncbi:MAG: crossover junction endodeoxyribonuclease RuvC [Planctomycetota bacterium]|nr:crossover junction endodeoxyribonuclease RuvC [Planctomycetota bacterium]
MKVLGIDPGTRIVGYAVAERAAIRSVGPARIVDAGIIRLDAKSTLEHRLVELHREIAALLEEHAPDLLVVEQVFSKPDHARAAIILAHARGVILLAAAQRGVAVGELAPAEVKKSLTGNGRATKLQMQRAVMSVCGLNTLPTPSDLADAIAIALCGAGRNGAVRRAPLRTLKVKA